MYNIIIGFPGSLAGKESAWNAGDQSSIPGSGRSSAEGMGYPFQYSWNFPGGSDGKQSACNAGDLGLIPGLGDPLEENLSNPAFLREKWKKKKKNRGRQ